jgi:outer membrane receptor protein involved in Fe transport
VVGLTALAQRAIIVGLRYAVVLALSIAFSSSTAAAQVGRAARDSTVPQLDTVVVTPNRSATSIRTSTVAVSAVPASLIRALPFRSLGDALTIAPGIAVVDASSLGGNPRIIARGFYGGGETDYVPAQIDGVPIAALGTGAVDWTMLPLGAFSRLELVRGATSYIHGDAALGGTLNTLIPILPGELAWRAAGGSYGVADAALGAASNFAGFAGGIAGDYRRSDGYRLDENSAAWNVLAKIGPGEATSRASAAGVTSGSVSAINAFVQLHGRDFKDPGPLPSTTADPRARNSFFRFDDLSDRVDRAGIIGNRETPTAKYSGYLVGEYASSRAVKTLPLSTDFADTKLRRTTAPRLLTSGQIELGDDVPGEFGRLVAGVDASAGRLSSRYSDIVAGDATAYAASDGSAGPEAAPSKATRTLLAGFMHWQLRPIAPLRLSLGARVDHIADKFAPSDPSTDSERKTNQAVSPRIAVNVALPASTRASTNVFVSTGRAFKSPTLDQLFDDRRIPIPVAPFSATVSNPNLVPQHGTAVEGGLYQTWIVGGGSRLDWSGTLYQEKMRDELDFDVNTFRYVNIGRSVHRGGELGLTLEAPAHWTAFGNFTQQQVRAENGQFDGKQLKAIPRRIASAGANVTFWRGLTAGIVASYQGGAFVDDANVVPLAGFTRLDSRLGIPFGRARMTIDLTNALNRRYDATAFPDPAGSPTIYRYPAAGRVLILGLESR